MKRSVFFKRTEGFDNFSIPLMIIASSLLISLFHYIAAAKMQGFWLPLHLILRRMYFFPVLLAAFYFGKRGAFMTCIFVTLVYLPHGVLHWPDTLAAAVDNFTDIALLWLVGGIAGNLSEKLKTAEAEKARLATLESISKVLSTVNSEVIIDYQACLGLAKALKWSGSHSQGDSLSAQMLVDRLEHLGSHLSNIHELVLPSSYTRKKFNLFKLVRKSIATVTLRSDKVPIKVVQENPLPDLLLDVERMQFAVTIIVQSMITHENALELLIRIQRKSSLAFVNFELHQSSRRAESKKWNPFDFYADPRQGYAFSLALSVIRSHGGKLEVRSAKDNMVSLCLSLPITLLDRLSSQMATEYTPLVK